MTGAEQQYGYYIVAYLDILNQSNFLKAMDFLPEDEHQKKKLIALAKESFGAVSQLREILAECFSKYKSSQVDLSKLSKEQQAQFHELNRTDLHFQGFSDCVAVFAPVFKGDQNSVNVMNVYSVMAACATLFLSFPATELCIRGGIDVGPGMIIFGNEFYGPALLSAYKLESDIAQYPRLAVGHGLINFILSTMQKADRSSVEGQFSYKLAETCMKMIVPDHDEWPILDYLGDEFGSIVSRDSQKPLIEAALKFIRKEKQAHIKAIDKKIFHKYCALEYYFLRRTEFKDSHG